MKEQSFYSQASANMPELPNYVSPQQWKPFQMSCSISKVA